MKLAAVNPRLDFDIEELLSKDVRKIRIGIVWLYLTEVCWAHDKVSEFLWKFKMCLIVIVNRFDHWKWLCMCYWLFQIFQLRGSTPSTVGFFPDMGMAHPQLHPLQQGLIQAASPSIGNHSDFLRRTISSQLTPMNGYKEPAPQVFYLSLFIHQQLIGRKSDSWKCWP